jgi:hypothetical protein
LKLKIDEHDSDNIDVKKVHESLTKEINNNKYKYKNNMTKIEMENMRIQKDYNEIYIKYELIVKEKENFIDSSQKTSNDAIKNKKK